MQDLILDQLGPRRVVDGKWYPDGTILAHKVGREIYSKATFCLPGNQTPSGLVSCKDTVVLSKDAELNLNSLSCIFSLTFSGGTNLSSTDRAVICGQNYLPNGIAASQEEFDQLQVEFGFPKGMIEVLEPGQKGEFPKQVHALHSNDKSAQVNPVFIRTIALLNPTNIMNGIVTIPREVCMADSRFIVWQPTSGETEPPKDAVHHWVVIPPRHILAIQLHNFKEWTGEPGHPHPITFEIGDRLICYALCDVEFEQLKAQVLKAWVPLIDCRPLSQLAFSSTVPAEINAKIGHVAWPENLTQADIDQLAPEFPPELERLFAIPK